MKKLPILSLMMAIGLTCGLVGGCGENKAAVITPDKKAQFGTANQPMPPEAREAIMKATQHGAPPAAAKKP